jgi:hypothetical protein
MRRISALLVMFALCAAAAGQSRPELAPVVRAFVSVDAPVVALVHVRVIDGTGAAPRADQTIVLRDGKIEALGDAGKVKIPDGAKVLDLIGYTVIP